MSEPSIRVGLIGTGFLAETRVRCYRKAGCAVRAVASRTEEGARGFASRHGIGLAFASVEELLASEEIDAVDLCVPNREHRPLAERAARAGKHVICTKPLAAYVGQDLDPGASERDVLKRDPASMLAVARRDAAAMVEVCRERGVALAYGKNWIYAPALRRARELLLAADARILEMRGWECHSGSHSPYAASWSHSGGGALLRLGAHPVGAMLHLKRIEGRRRLGAPIRPVSVFADTARPSASADTSQAAFVESFGCLVIAFSDGSRGVALGSDHVLGGMESRLEIHADRAHVKCNLSPQDALRVYASDPSVWEGQYLMEKADPGAGWNTAMPDEDWSSGHQAMLDAFLDDFSHGRTPESDGELGLQVTEAIYAGYQSAREGRRVELDA